MANKPNNADQMLTTIYFMAAHAGPIKIGRAKNPEKRKTELQTGHPAQLVVLAKVAGPPDLERRYHRIFKQYHLHGEWFERCADIEHEILRIDPSAMARIDEWADLAGSVYGCPFCGDFPCRSFVYDRAAPGLTTNCMEVQHG